MRHYMRMTTQIAKFINLFPDQIVEEDNIVDDRYHALADVPLLVIDWSEEEVINLLYINLTY